MKDQNKLIPFAIYIRKSTEQDDRQMLSIESQMEELKNFARKEELYIERTFIDAASAHKVNNRPAFTQLLEAVETKKIRGILTWKEDRLARNMVEGGQLIYLLQNGVIEQVRTPFTLYRPKDNTLPLTIAFGMANQYSKDLSDNVSRGMRTKAANGGFCFMAPMGYQNNRLEKTVEKDPAYFLQIKQFWKRYLSANYSLADICRLANKQGFLTPKRGKRGGKKLCVSTLQSVFINPFYAGLISSDSNLIKGIHTPMVTEIEFAKVQALLGRNGIIRGRKNSKKFILKGLITCGVCGCSVTAEKKWKYFCPKCKHPRTKKSPHDCPKCKFSISQRTISKANQYIYYHCTKGKGNCTQKCSREAELMNQIETELDQLSLEKHLIPWAKQWTDYVIDTSGQEQSKQNQVSQKKQRQLQERLKRLLEMRIDKEISGKEYLEQKQSYEQQVSQIEATLNKTCSVKEWKLKAQSVIIEQSKLSNCLQLNSEKNLSAYLSEIFSNLTLKDKKLGLQVKEMYYQLRKAVLSANGTFEPPQTLLNKCKNDSFERQYQEWWSLVEYLRTEV